MTDPWNGRPPGGAAERDGWHWVATMTSDTSLARWVAIVDQWMLVGTSRGYRPITDTAGWRYLGPCLPPAEIAALRAERDRLREALREQLAEHNATWLAARAEVEGARMSQKLFDLEPATIRAREALGDER